MLHVKIQDERVLFTRIINVIREWKKINLKTLYGLHDEGYYQDRWTVTKYNDMIKDVRRV